MISQYDMEELGWPVQSPNISPIQHLGNEPELQLRDRPHYPSSVVGLTNALIAEWQKTPAD